MAAVRHCNLGCALRHSRFVIRHSLVIGHFVISHFVREDPMAHPLFAPEVRMMLQENDSAEIQAFCETLHPATVAETLEGEFSVEDVWKFLAHTSIKTQAAIFEYFPLEWQVQMV